jgi:N utilization substance protein B
MNNPTPNPTQKISTQGRSLARQRLVQALYQWQLTGHSVQTIEAQFLAEVEEDMDMGNVDRNYFHALLYAIPKCIDQLDTALTPWLDRQPKLLDPTERAILWVGCYELLHCSREVPWRVVINEGVELAKLFGAEKSHKYVNGILDKLAHSLHKSPPKAP